MEYFNISQIILLIFVGITNIVIIGWAVLDEHSGGEFEISDFYKVFCMWSIYMVLSFGIYHYLGTI